MASETDLLNDALGMISAGRITSINDGSTNATFCQTFYPPLRRGLLRSHHWNFILTRVELARDVAAPLFGFAYAYTLPPDNLKVVDYGGSLTAAATPPYVVWSGNQGQPYYTYYKIERNKLLSNDGQAWILYLRDVTNPDEWDALFYQAVAAFLGSKLAMAIPKDPKKSQALLEQAEHFMSMAMAVDGQEGSTQPFVVDDLTWGR